MQFRVPSNKINYQLASEAVALLPAPAVVRSSHGQSQKINPNNSHLFGHKLNCLALYLPKHDAQSGEEAEHMARAERRGGLFFSQQPTVTLH